MNKSEFLIKQILIKRNESIIKIQNFFRKIQIQKKLKEFSIIKKILLNCFIINLPSFHHRVFRPKIFH